MVHGRQLSVNSMLQRHSHTPKTKIVPRGIVVSIANVHNIVIVGIFVGEC